jgi:hypothetical protein
MPRSYYNENYLMAKFSDYAYFDKSKLADGLFPRGLGYVCPETGTKWDFDPQDDYSTADLGSHCYIFTCRYENDIAVVFRGTDRWIIDLDADIRLVFGSAAAWGQTNAKVSSALLRIWEAIKPRVTTRLTQLINSRTGLGPCRLIVTGHSLGAMVATVAGLSLKEGLLTSSPPFVKVVQFAGGPIGNQDFVTRFQNAFTRPGVNYSFYRNSRDFLISALVVVTRASSTLGTAYVDFQNILQSPRFGGGMPPGHHISGYIDALKPMIFPTLPPDRTPAPVGSLYPDTSLTSLSLLLVFEKDPASPPAPLPQPQLNFYIGPILTGTCLSLLLDKAARATVAGVTQYLFSFTGPSLAGLRVSDLSQSCLALVPSPELVSGSSALPAQRVVIQGVEIVANGFSIYTDYLVSASVSDLNPTFSISPTTPHYNIVGGEMVYTNWDQPEPLKTLSSWGQQTDHRMDFYGGRCWTPAHKSNSWSVQRLCLSEFGTGTNLTRETKVVGGSIEVSDYSSNKPFIETYRWGERSGKKMRIGSNMGWSSQYEGDSQYYYYLFLDDSPDRSNSCANVVGWRFEVTSHDSSQPREEISFIGQRSPYQVRIASGYGRSRKYPDGYFYAFFYLDRPVFELPNPTVTKSVTIIELKCITPSETGLFDNGDEVYIKRQGTKVWPATGYQVMAAGDRRIVWGLPMVIASDQPQSLEIWDADDISADDKLYVFDFSMTSLWRSDNGNVTQLQYCDSGSYTSQLGAVANCKYELRIQVYQ